MRECLRLVFDVPGSRNLCLLQEEITNTANIQSLVISWKNGKNIKRYTGKMVGVYHLKECTEVMLL